MGWNVAKVRALVEEQGRTTRWLARECGVECNTMQHILAGRRPGLPVIKLMAIALKVPETDLYSDPEQPVLQKAGQAK